MSNHTPGPWEVEPYSDESEEPINIVSEFKALPDGRKSANWIAECILEDDVEENRRNARLIAAAPELLDALKEMVKDRIEDGYSEDPLVKMCEDAIKKAEGR